MDGGFGTALIQRGITGEEQSEQWNISHPEDVIAVHLSFLEAGAEMILANTFGANKYHYDSQQQDRVIRAAVGCAREAVVRSGKEAFVALDIGSTGHLLPPMGMVPFEEAVETFAQMVRIGVEEGVDLIQIETMNDVYELKAAVTAARENSDLPVFATAVFDDNARTLTGTTPAGTAAMLEGLGCTAVGLNCGIGPKAAKAAIEQMAEGTSLPLIVKPNAGLPRVSGGTTVFDVDPEEFQEDMKAIMQVPGVRIVGGCCGTTPEHLRLLTEAAHEMKPVPALEKTVAFVTSYQEIFDVSETLPKIFTIDAQENKDLAEDLKNGMADTAAMLADDALDEGAQVIGLRLKCEDTDEAENFRVTIGELQMLNTMPLCIDSCDPAAVDAALRVYNGKAMVDGRRADEEAQKQMIASVRKYGAVLLLNKGREEIMQGAAEACGFSIQNLIFC